VLQGHDPNRKGMPGCRRWVAVASGGSGLKWSGGAVQALPRRLEAGQKAPTQPRKARIAAAPSTAKRRVAVEAPISSCSIAVSAGVRRWGRRWTPSGERLCSGCAAAGEQLALTFNAGPTASTDQEKPAPDSTNGDQRGSKTTKPLS